MLKDLISSLQDILSSFIFDVVKKGENIDKEEELREELRKER